MFVFISVLTTESFTVNHMILHKNILKTRNLVSCLLADFSSNVPVFFEFGVVGTVIVAAKKS